MRHERAHNRKTPDGLKGDVYCQTRDESALAGSTTRDADATRRR